MGLVIAGLALVASAGSLSSDRASPDGSARSSPAAVPALAAPLRSSGAPRPDATLTLGVTGETPTAISLSWTTSSTTLFSSYTVEYSNTSATGPFLTADVITSSGTTTFGFAPLVPSATYWWEVTETQTLVGTSTSNVVAATQPATAFLTAHEESGNPPPIQLNWTDNATYGGLLSFESFEVFEESASTGGTYQLAATVTTVGTHSYTLFDLPAGNYSFDVNTTDCLSCGASGASSLTTTSNLAVVGTPFPLGASISAAHTVLDVNEPDVLLCAPSGGEPSYSYAWSIDGGAFASGNATLGLAFSASGTQTVTCRITDGTPTSASTSIDLTVNPALVVTPSLNRTSADVGEPVAFNCGSTGGTSPVSYSWSFGDGTGLSGSTATHAYDTAGNIITTCVASDNAGVTTSASELLDVSPALWVAVQASSDAAAPGTALAFTASPHNGSGDYSNFSWQFGSDPGRASADEASFTFSAPGTYTVTVRVTDSNGVPASSSTSVDVSQIAVTALTEPTHGTVGSALTFSAGASGGAGGPYNYTWSFGDGSIGYGAKIAHDFGTAGTYTPTLTVRDRLGATNVTDWPAVSVAPAPGPLAWLPLWVLVVAGAATGALVAVGVYLSLRETDSAMLARWVPPVGPRGALQGSKTCPKCGAENPPVRRSCNVCGSALPKKPHDA